MSENNNEVSRDKFGYTMPDWNFDYESHPEVFPDFIDNSNNVNYPHKLEVNAKEIHREPGDYGSDTIVDEEEMSKALYNLTWNDLMFVKVPDLKPTDSVHELVSNPNTGDLLEERVAEAYLPEGNPWKYLVKKMYYQDSLIYDRGLHVNTAIRLGLVNGSDRIVFSKDFYDIYSQDHTTINYPYCHFNFEGRRGDAYSSAEVEVLQEMKRKQNFFYYTPEGNDEPYLNSFFRFNYALPKNESSKNLLRWFADYLSKVPINGKDINELFGGPSMHFGGLSVNEFENVGNQFPEDVDEVKLIIQDGDIDTNTGEIQGSNSIFDQIKAQYTFAFAKINPTIVFERGAIANCHGMFKGTRGTTNDPKRRQYEVYYSPCKLKVDLQGKKPSAVFPFLGFVPTTLADCFKFSYLNQKSYDAFFLNANMVHCRQFAGAFSEQVFNRVFNAEEDGFAPEMVGHHRWAGDYGKITIKCPKKASTPKEEWDDSMLTVWTPGQNNYDTVNIKWLETVDTGSIAYMCKYSHVAAIEPIIDLKYVLERGLTQAFHNPPGQIEWPGYRGIRSQIKEVRIRNLGNMDINFAGTVSDWATTNSPDWNVESLSEESIVFMLNNMRDQSPYVAGKENEQFLIGGSFKLRIPKTWERLLTGPMIKELIRKGWVLYIGNDEKSINDCIVCAEETE